MPSKNKEQSNKSPPSKQPERQKNYAEVKNYIMDYLQQYKEEINDNTRNSIKVLPLSIEDLDITPVALELIENETGEIEESLDKQTKRGTIINAVEQLIENVESEKKFVVVNVNTPAVDLNKVFDKEQLKFMKNDIFKSIQSQLGAELTEDIQEQWGTAFNAMMDVVNSEKKGH